MKWLGVTIAMIVLGGLSDCPAACASLTRAPVSKGSALERELGYTITVSVNGEYSELAGTVTVEFRAPRTARLRNLARVILLTRSGKQLTGRMPLETQQGKAGEVLCHFQLTPAAAKG